MKSTRTIAILFSAFLLFCACNEDVTLLSPMQEISAKSQGSSLFELEINSLTADKLFAYKYATPDSIEYVITRRDAQNNSEYSQNVGLVRYLVIWQYENDKPVIRHTSAGRVITKWGAEVELLGAGQPFSYETRSGGFRIDRNSGLFFSNGWIRREAPELTTIPAPARNVAIPEISRTDLATMRIPEHSI